MVYYCHWRALMRMSIIRRLMVVALVSGVLAASGCYVQAVEPGGEVVVGNYGYEPMYYNGYMVYYDAGRPFYWVGGSRIWISPSSPYYAGYIGHYRTYGNAYSRWYAGHGHRYHGYRAPAGFYGGHRTYVQQHRRAPARPVHHRR